MATYFCLSIFLFLFLRSFEAASYKNIVKRQTTLAFTSASTFNLKTLYYNNIVGKVTTNYPSGTTFSIVYPSNNFAINIRTGDIITINNLSQCSTYTLVVRAQNPSVSSNTDQNINFRTPCSSSTTTTASSVSGRPYFQQSTVYISTGCTVNSLAGIVTATGSNIIYNQSSPYFSINPINGNLFLLNPPPANPTTIPVTATNSAGSATVNVVVYTTCPPSTAKPIFSSSSYMFATTGSCLANTAVGKVSATSTGASIVSYQIVGGAVNYAVDNTGQIRITTPPTAGTVQMLTIRATDSLGRTNDVPVTLTSFNCGNVPPDYG